MSKIRSSKPTRTSANVRLFGDLEQYPADDPVAAAEFLYSLGMKVIPFEVSKDGSQKKPDLDQWTNYDLSLDELKSKVSRTSALGIVVPQGSIVVDLDCAKDGTSEGCKYLGLDNLADMSEELGVRNLDFLDTVTTSTPTGGMHLWYRIPPHVKLKNSAGLLAPGIDIRVAGTGLIIMPSTITSFGRYDFTVIGATMSVAKIPPWLLKILQERDKIENRLSKEVLERVRRKIETSKDQKQYLAGCYDDIANSPSGRRNNTLNAVAYGVYRRVVNEEIDMSLAEETLEMAAAHTGLGDREIERTLASAKKSAFSAPAFKRNPS